MNFPVQIRRVAVVFGSTALGTALGYSVIRLAGQALARHLPTASASAKHDLGDMAVFFVSIGYNLGLVAGVLMTVAVLGGLMAGLALCRRVTVPSAAN